MDSEKEYQEIQKSAGFFDFSMEGKIFVSGDGRIDFVNGIVTNDVASLSENQGCYAAFLNKIGKVLSDCVVYKLDDKLLITMNVAGKKNVLSKLTEEAPLGKSQVEDVSMKYGLFHVAGKECLDALERCIGTNVSIEKNYEVSIQNISVKKEFNEEKDNNSKEKNNEIEIIITKNNRTALDGFDVFVPATSYTDFKKMLIDSGVSQKSNDVFERLRLEAGIPLYGIDFDENNILPEIGENAVSYSKGCFVGQEIVVRVKNLAKGMTAKKLVSFEVDTDQKVKSNEKIVKNSKEAGFITSSAYSFDRKKVVALGFLNKAFYSEKEFEVDGKKASVVVP